MNAMSVYWNALVTSVLLIAYPVLLTVCLWAMCIIKTSLPSLRLAADLSPDTLEESEESAVSSPSSSSSEEEEEKLKAYEDGGHNSSTQPQAHPRFSPTSASASAAPSKNAKDIYNQGHVDNQVTPSMGPVSATSLPSTSTASEGATNDQAQNYHRELNSNHASDYVTRTAGPTSPDTARSHNAGRKHFTQGGTAVVAHGTKRRADDSTVHEPRVAGLGNANHEYARDSVSDDDNDSIEDVSISHNVPMCPPSPPSLSPSRSPALSRRAVVAAEETGGASGSSSDSETCITLTKSSGLHLDVQRRTTKYQGPYTLACDVTPSPLQENVTMASTLTGATNSSNGQATAATMPSSSSSSSSCSNNNLKLPRRPRKLPEIPRKHQGLATASSSHIRSIFDEIQEALIKEASDDVFEASSSASDVDAAQQYPYIHKHMGHLFDKKRLLIGYAKSPARSARSRDVSTSSVSSRSRNVSTSSVASEAGAAASVEEEIIIAKAQLSPSSGISSASTCSQQRRRKNSDGDGSRRHSSSTMSTPYHDLEVTHRGMHRFIPRHADEVQVGIGDPIHVIKEYDDLWCEGVNLRSGERGIFPAMYANDLTFLEDSDGDEEHWKFTMRFLGAVEVTSSNGDFALCQAIHKVAQQGRIRTASLCTLEINQYGIRMIDKSKEGHQSQKFTNFFALKNISFCGTHPNNNRYFAFITKHPREVRFACHVFHSDRSTHRARDALGNAFKRFYQEYMAFTHPTEDIWIE